MIINLKKMCDSNPLLNFFQQDENKNKKLSSNTLAKELNLPRKQIWYYKNQSDNLVSVPPSEVGSNARRLYVIKYTEEPSNYNESDMVDALKSKKKIKKDKNQQKRRDK